MKPILSLLIALVAAVVAAPANAHELRPSVLTMVETEPGVFDVRLKVSTIGPTRVRLTPVLPQQCQAIGPPSVAMAAGAEVRRFTADCGGSIDGETVAIEGLRGTLNDVLVRIERATGTVQSARVLPEAPTFVIDAEPTSLDVLKTYAVLGMQHILLGLDHLLFVIALLVLIRSVRALVAAITAFTLAHSLTLALSALGLADAPQGLVEILVALSIVFVAAEIVKIERGDPAEQTLPASAVAFAFGLLHGLGFGGALKEIGLPDGEVPLALFAFNVGVEAGQLSIVVVTLATVASIKLLLALPPFSARLLSGYAIGAVSATWFVQRLADMARAI